MKSVFAALILERTGIVGVTGYSCGYAGFCTEILGWEGRGEQNNLGWQCKIGLLL